MFEDAKEAVIWRIDRNKHETNTSNDTHHTTQKTSDLKHEAHYKPGWHTYFRMPSTSIRHVTDTNIMLGGNRHGQHKTC